MSDVNLRFAAVCYRAAATCARARTLGHGVPEAAAPPVPSIEAIEAFLSTNRKTATPIGAQRVNPMKVQFWAAGNARAFDPNDNKSHDFDMAYEMDWSGWSQVWVDAFGEEVCPLGKDQFTLHDKTLWDLHDKTLWDARRLFTLVSAPDRGTSESTYTLALRREVDAQWKEYGNPQYAITSESAQVRP